MGFEFSTSRRIIFGQGVLSHLKDVALAPGNRILVLHAPSSRGLDHVRETLGDGADILALDVRGEPTIEWIESAVRACQETRRDVIVGIGGGSTLDSAKAVAALATNLGDVRDYLEVIGKNKPLTQLPLPCIAVPTTAGTGSEVTRNAVLKSERDGVKVSLRSPNMLPLAAIVDPLLTLDVPQDVTASTGMDALTQVLEPFVSKRRNPLTDLFCRDGLSRAASALRRAYHKGTDAKAREDMAWASLMGGMALANAGLGAVHGFAAPIGGMFAAPHGAVCARLLPVVTAMNIKALQAREPGSEALERYREIAHILCGDERADFADLVDWLRNLGNELRIPGLSTYGIDHRDIPSIVEKAQPASSMKANPIVLESAELTLILQEAL